MKSLSPENRERIRRLSGDSSWSRIFVSAAEQIELLQQIGFSNEAMATPEIAWLLVEARGSVWRAASETVHRLLKTLRVSSRPSALCCAIPSAVTHFKRVLLPTTARCDAPVFNWPRMLMSLDEV